MLIINIFVKIILNIIIFDDDPNGHVKYYLK